jgi:hypothetical protein
MNRKASARRWLEAVERATEWELFDARRLPRVPRWVNVVIVAGWVLAIVASLAAALFGGPS